MCVCVCACACAPVHVRGHVLERVCVCERVRTCVYVFSKRRVAEPLNLLAHTEPIKVDSEGVSVSLSFMREFLENDASDLYYI